MSVLIYAESSEGQVKKVAYELASYGKKIADSMGTTVTALTINANDVAELGQYGVSNVLKVSDANLTSFNAKAYANVVAEAAKKVGAKVVLVASTTDSLYLAPLAAVQLEAGYATNVVALPVSTSPLQVKRNAFSNKAFAVTELTKATNVLAIAKNSFGLHQNAVAMSEEAFSVQTAALNAKVESVDKTTGKVTIADAEVVVSGGRGLKGPENWGLVENLASVLGAATACSKPVSDLGWRSHSEHVGQTGKPVATNLYIAIGISGAIQHIAGINASKVKLVINNDAEAPFFKVADYGVVGDAFEIVPKLTEKLKAFKANN